MAATVFNSATSNPGGTGTTLTVTLSTHAANDILLIYVAVTGNVTWTAPVGYTLLDQRTVGTASTGIVGTWFWRKVLTSDSLPLANPSCTLGATVTRAAICLTVRGADLEGPFTLPEYGERGFATGTANPVRPPTVTTLAPDMLVIHGYGSRTATNAPEPTGYTQDQEVVISGTLVLNIAEQTVSANQTALSNQDASPTSGVRWTAGIVCFPSPDYVYYRSGTQALTASGTSATPTLPVGTLASDNRGNRDLMIATVEAAGIVDITAQDSSWREISDARGTTSGDGSSVKKFWKLVQGSDNLQFNRATTGEIAVCITTYRNTRQTNPIANANIQQVASSTTSTWIAQDRRYARSTVIASCVADGVPTFTVSAATERMDGNGITCADRVYDAIGATPSGSFTLSTASSTLNGLVEVIAFSVALSTLLPNNFQSVDSSMSVGERVR